MLKDVILGQSYSELVATRIWKCIETGLCTSVVSKMVIADDERVANEIGCGSGKVNITVVSHGSVIGEVMPPYVVYKADYKDGTMMVQITPGYVASSSGWIKEAQFTEWFNSVFLPYTSKVGYSGFIVVFLWSWVPHNY